MKTQKNRKIIGYARIIDCQESGYYRVRMLDEDRLPKGRVLTGVKLLPDAEPVAVNKPLPDKSEQELDAMAYQNILYNSHLPVEII